MRRQSIFARCAPALKTCRITKYRRQNHNDNTPTVDTNIPCQMRLMLAGDGYAMRQPMTISDHFKAHVDYLQALSDSGDDMAAKSLACMQLLQSGWRYGDPDPDGGDGPDDDGGEPMPSNVIPFRRAA